MRRAISFAFVFVLVLPLFFCSVYASTIYEFYPFEMPAVLADYDFIGADDESFIYDGLVPEGQYRLEIDLSDEGSDYDLWITTVTPFVVSYELISGDLGGCQVPVVLKYFIPDYPDADDGELAHTFTFTVTLLQMDGSTLFILRNESGDAFPPQASHLLRMISVDPLPEFSEVVSSDSLGLLLDEVLNLVCIVLPVSVCFIAFRKGISYLCSVVTNS